MLKKLLERQEIRFLFVGVLNTIVGYGIYAILVFFDMHYLIANTISTILGVAHSYLWNRFFTFKSKEKAGKEIIKFTSVYLLSYVIGTITLAGFKNILHISPYLAGLFNLVITTLISYFGHKNFSFKKTNVDWKETWKQNKKYLFPILLFFIYFFTLFSFRHAADFTDEGDVLLGAMTLANKGFIYKDFASQHVPFTYMFFSIFAFFGVHSVYGFRICMYVVLALFFTFLYVHYHKKIGKFPLILYPFVYMLFMSYTAGTGVLSEHIESQCLVVLFLELLLFWKERKLSLTSKLIIPIAIVTTVLSAFVSIIPCFVIVLTFIVLDIQNYKGKNWKTYLNHFWKEYHIILFTGLGLLGLFLLYLLFTGTLIECYEQAFALNTTVYSRYVGYSSNPFKTMLTIVWTFITSFDYHLTKDNLLLVCLTILLSFYIWKVGKKSIGFALISTYIILLCGNRTFINFHALPFYATLSIAVLYAVQKWRVEIVALGVCLFFIAFLLVNQRYLRVYFTPYKIDETYYQDVNKLLNSDRIFHIDINTPSFLHANKLSASKFSGMVPWFAEIYEKDFLNDIKKQNPNILYYEPYGSVWGYIYKDFVPEITEYIMNNYVYNKEYQIWIRKDYLQKSEEILHKDFAEYTNFYANSSPLILQNNTLEEWITPEENIQKLNLFLGTFERTNYSHLIIEIEENEEKIYEKEISASALKDNDWYEIDCKLKKRMHYKLKIYSKYTNVSDYIAVYIVNDDINKDENTLYINEENSFQDLLMEFYYE